MIHPQQRTAWLGTMGALFLTMAAMVSHGQTQPATPPQLAPPSPAKNAWSAPFFFIQMTDPQFGMFTGNKNFTKETELYTQAIAAANRLQPAFVVITGDLVNKTGDAAQIAEFKRISATLDPTIPLYLVAGNHDVGGTPTPPSIDAYRQAHGRDYYSYDLRGCHFIVLDSTVLQTPTQAPQEMQAQLAWLQTDLAAAAKPPHLIVFMHHPLFTQKSDEKDSYHNLPLERRQQLLELFHQYDVHWIFAGHLHHVAAGKDGPLNVIASGPVGQPLGKDPSGFCIVKVYADRVEQAYVGLAQVPDHVTMEVAK